MSGVSGGVAPSLMSAAVDAHDLSRALGADEVSVSVSRSSEISLQRRAGKLEQSQRATSLGLSVSLLVGDRFSSHSTSDLRPEALRAFLERAVDATRALEPEVERRQADGALCGRGSPDELLDQNDGTWAALTASERGEKARELEAAVDALPHRNRIISATVALGDSSSESVRVMTNGFVGEHRGTAFGMSVEMTLEEPGGRRPEAWSHYGANHQQDLPNVAFLADEAWKRAEQRLASGPIASGRYPMLLENHAAGRILGVIGGPLSGSELHQGRSCLAGKKGAVIGSSKFSLYDDPTIPRGLGSRPWDGDAFRARPMPVVEAGVLQNYYLSLYYARKLGMDPTSGGRSNWVVPPGERSVAAILKDMPKCIVVTGFLGGNGNGVTGDFSYGVQGMLYENGVATANLSEMNISGNVLEIFHQFEESANDPYLYSSVRSPSLVFDGVQFSGV
jgi:PmbA protein